MCFPSLKIIFPPGPTFTMLNLNRHCQISIFSLCRCLQLIFVYNASFPDFVDSMGCKSATLQSSSTHSSGIGDGFIGILDMFGLESNQV